jgi:cell migration-inducing and hyaluronan-binding protein
VTTAVYPACAREGPPPPGEPVPPVCGRNYPIPPNDPPPPPYQNPNWDSDCANPNCYGVPLYRQRLTSKEPPDPNDIKQSIRMMGGNLWQRNTLTANNGVYYMDTARKKDQDGSAKKNIFEADRT